jgi:hypothetical protein
MPMILIRLFRSMVSRDIDEKWGDLLAAAPTLGGLALLNVVAHGRVPTAARP